MATVDSNGKITPVGLGETKITAEANGYTATCTVKVIELVSSITLDKTDLSLNACLPTATLTATVKSDPSYVKGVSWSSGDKKVAPRRITSLPPARSLSPRVVWPSARLPSVW